MSKALVSGTGFHKNGLTLGRGQLGDRWVGTSRRISSTRDCGEYLFLGRALVKNQKAFLKCSIKKFPFCEILKTISEMALRQGLF